MNKKEIITINGNLGSGKSSTANLVAQNLGYTRFSSGDFFRQVGVELGLSVTELNIRAETDGNIDKMTDEKVRSMREKEKIVIDSRTAYHWIPESFKVYLILPPEIAKDRIMKNLEENKLRQETEKATNAEEVYTKMNERYESEQKRYAELYNIDNTDMTKYDLVIDTNKNNLEEVVNVILEEYKKWREN